MKRIMTVIGGVVLTALIAVGGVSAQQAKHSGSIQVKNEDEAGLAGMAKISLDSAVNAALQAVPGKALKAELENENGYLVYGVEIAKADHQIADVKVDAGDGKVLKIDTDQKDNEGHEREDSDNGHEEGGER
ncbi:MAG: PepSY domain-containing protein [Deltaproteobacteria bacterium]|nr:PepSY domain-containing protein [Deltaproteobacteria bacterium]